MLFNSYLFIFLFFPLVLLGYYTLGKLENPKIVQTFIICMSLWFYGYNSFQYLLVLVDSVIINYFLAALIKEDASSKIRPLFLQNIVVKFRRFIMIIGILINLGILFIFKYYNFFIDNFNHLAKKDVPFLSVALPLGISFYTFQQLSYCIDAYRGECEDYDFIEYAAYVTFFPQLIAGPIVFHTELIPQFRDSEKRKFNTENFARGLYAFALGLGKKVLLADSLSKIVTNGYNNIPELNSISSLLLMLSYTLQIYFDFSGYCDMAYGIGYMMNIELPVNFNSPYKATSISEFWDRWHITLTRFFTRYLYIPLGGNRKGQARTFLNVFIVFMVSGLWHGANWTFILWGALHGVAMLIDRAITLIYKKYNKVRGKLFQTVSAIITFLFVNIAWSIFRSPTLTDAFSLIHQLVYGGFGRISYVLREPFSDLIEVEVFYRLGLERLPDHLLAVPLAIVLGILLTICCTTKNTQEKSSHMKWSFQRCLFTAILLFWCVISMSEISEFLYFNF